MKTCIKCGKTVVARGGSKVLCAKCYKKFGKTCDDCGKSKTPECFPSDWSSEDGRYKSCKDCGSKSLTRRKSQQLAGNSLRRIRKRGILTEQDLELSAARREAICNDPCFYCGASQAEQYHIDHFYPLSKGGDDRWSNLVRACEHCNLSKLAKCGTVFMLTLRKET